MVEETIFQNFIFSQFILPFLLIFTIVFAILEKTNVLGKEKTQINAIVAFVIGILFVSVAYPKMVVANMILFLTVALIITFVVMLLIGFVIGGDPSIPFGDGGTKALRWVVGIVIVLAVTIATVWATGMKFSVIESLFLQGWSKAFWTNLLFVVVIAGALALVIKGGSSGGKGKKD